MKAIKFNLSYGNEQIKTLAELKENCNVDMLLETLKNGLLARWLTAQGETALSEKVSAIDTADNRSALKMLFKVLFEKDASVMEQSAAEIFTVREKEAERLLNLSKLAEKENGIIAQYHEGYDDLIEALKANKNDYPSLKAGMITLYAQYRKLLLLDKNKFYETFKDGYPLVLLSFMANQTLCEYFFSSSEEVNQVYEDVLPQLEIEGIIKNIKLAIRKGEKSPAVELETEEQLEKFKSQNQGKTFIRIAKSSPGYNDSNCSANCFYVGDFYIPYDALFLPHIKIFSGETDRYWKDIEAAGQTFMIISMEEGNKVRNSGANGEELSADDVNGKFIFTNGIDYMSNSDSDKLIYMEV